MIFTSIPFENYIHVFIKSCVYHDYALEAV